MTICLFFIIEIFLYIVQIQALDYITWFCAELVVYFYLFVTMYCVICVCPMSYINHIFGAFVLSISILPIVTQKKKEEPKGFRRSFLLTYLTETLLPLVLPYDVRQGKHTQESLLRPILMTFAFLSNIIENSELNTTSFERLSYHVICVTNWLCHVQY